MVRLADGKRQFALVRWGLIPSWVEDPRRFSLLINARADSVNDKPAFRAAMKYRRCLIPADGFYEWQEAGGRKRPFAVRPRKGGPVAFAGLWESWMGPNGEEMETAAIITTDACRSLRDIHHRMPVVVPPDAFDFWLDCKNVDAQMAAAVLTPPPDDLFEAYEISTAVNRTANDGPEVIAPLPSQPSQPAEAAAGVPAESAAPAESSPDVAAPPAPAPAPAAPAGKRPRKKDDRQPSLF
jgi:putative SOS response-associated peptidase YedK